MKRTGDYVFYGVVVNVYSDDTTTVYNAYIPNWGTLKLVVELKNMSPQRLQALIGKFNDCLQQIVEL